MSDHAMKWTGVRRTTGCLVICLLVAISVTGQAATIVNDSWADGGRDNGPDPLDSNWWTSSTRAGIEVSVGSLGMVTGTSGRGIHTVFPTQTLGSIGDSLVATYTFRTPATVGMGGTNGFRVGLFDTLDRALLDAEVSASSGTPNEVYGWGTAVGGPGTAGLPGYMFDMDVGTGTENLNFRAHDAGTENPTGRLVGTTTGFINLAPSGPAGAYTFAPDTEYTGTFQLTRASETEMQLTGTLGTATHTVTDAFDSAKVGMLAFWANSNLFGSTNTPGEVDNGIDYSNVKIEFLPAPSSDENTWAVDANGNWSAAANWSGGVPNAAGAAAVFGGVISLARTITVDSSITVGRIELESVVPYTIAGTNALTLDATSGDAQVNVMSGAHTISAPVTLADNTVINVALAASSLSLTGTLTANGRSVSKAGAGTLTVNNLRAQSLSINGGTVGVAPNGTPAGTSAVSALSIAGAPDAWTARLDLANNDAILQSSAANKSADFARLYSQVKQGFNSGDWQGRGISSATAAANASADTGVAVVDNALLGYTNFSGQPVTADSILLKYAYYGDIDQNGQVDADDLTVFASNFGRAAGATQVDGDIDFNGAVNADDLTVFANNFNKGVGNPLMAGGIQAVPEPGTLALAGLGVALVLVRVRARCQAREGG
jgi:hypothetical protein